MRIDIADYLNDDTTDESHIDPITAEDYANNELSELDTKQVTEHLNDCSLCRKSLTALADVKMVQQQKLTNKTINTRKFVQSFLLKLNSETHKISFRSELYFIASVISVALSLVWPARFWQFLTIAILFVARFTVIRLETKRFLKIEKLIDLKSADPNKEKEHRFGASKKN